MKLRHSLFLLLPILSGCGNDTPVVLEPGIFSEEWPTAIQGRLTDSKRCSVDSANGQDIHQGTITVKSGEALDLAGWVYSEKDGAPADVYVQLVGPALSYTAITRTRIDRPDVTDFFKLDPAIKAGFTLHAVQNAEPGQYQFQVLMPGAHGTVQCETRAGLKVEPANR